MIKEKDQVPAHMVFFLITAAQVGVGMLGFQSIINKYAGYDAWISLLIAGIGVSVVIWIMYGMLDNSNQGDIIGIHRHAFGKWIGPVFTVMFAAYLLVMAIVVLRTYVEIIQVWMFPQVKVWALLLLLLPLIYYVIYSEFRVVVGVCFLGVIYPSFLSLALFFPLKYAEVSNMMPVFDHSLIEILQSSSLSIINFMGLSTLLVYYPFIKESSASQKFAHYGNGYTTIIYTIVCIVSYLYYNQQELEEIIWATLGLWKIIELPFLARFEYFGIATLFFSILPNVVLFMWASSRTLARQFNWPRKKLTVYLLAILYIVCVLFENRASIALLNDMTGKIGIWFMFVYIPLLFVLHFFHRKIRRVKKDAS